MIGFSALGFLTLVLLHKVPMQKHTEETYGLQAESAAATVECPLHGLDKEGKLAKLNTTSIGKLSALQPNMWHVHACNSPRSCLACTTCGHHAQQMLGGRLLFNCSFTHTEEDYYQGPGLQTG